ncbi:MAG: glutaredoxin family protein [Gammaproteobacteria bacterium]|nr:glutaredoxin family protein [Gammaproteobacteria bacterium]MBU1655748.1 glutaredoxin family protein [Gammaproteobacteria bacterium]MBU1960709.1 glutaredoxin family protein [Gammaproteobacteria bacterium]
MNRRRISLGFLVLMMLGFNCSAEVYRWLDGQGQVQLGDRPPANVQAQSLDLRINSYSPQPLSPAPVAAQGQGKPVVVYSAAWCPACVKAKKYLQARNIPYTEYDIERSAQGRRDYQRYHGKGVPLIVVGESRMTGFSASLFNQLYGTL